MEEENNNPKKFFSNYTDTVTEYIDDRLLLLRLQTVKKISTIIGQMICIAVIMGLCLLIFLFISVMLGFLLGKWLDSYFAGFGIVTGLFIITLIFIIVKRRWVQSKFIGSFIIDILLDKNDDEDENA